MGVVVNCAAYESGRRIVDLDIDDAQQMKVQPGRVIWIGLHEPSQELMLKLQRYFGLHDLAVEDAYKAHQRPKLEIYGDTLFVVMKTAQFVGEHVSMGEAGYWVIGEKGRAKVFFAVWVLFCALGALQLQFGAVDGIKGGVFVPVRGAWLPTLGALGTAGIGPLYAALAWAFGGAGTEPVRTLTQEYGATYVMVAGFLNWLCCFDLWDRITGRWIFRLPKDEQIQMAKDLLPKGE